MNLAFLLYVSRSGSTLLARHIQARSERIAVLPESRLAEVLLSEGSARLRSRSADHLLRVMRLDPQLRNLDLSDSELREIAAEGLDSDRVIAGVLGAVGRVWAARRGLQPRTSLFKQGNLLHLAPALLEEVPDARYIHIFRDGRAVASSMLRAINPYFKRESLAQGSVLHAALYWRRYMRESNYLATARRDRYIEVRFEQFVQDAERVASDLVIWLGETPRPTALDVHVVAEPERSLHDRVLQAIEPARAVAWREELTAADKRVFEVVAGAQLEARGYPLERQAGRSWRDGGLMLRAALRHAYGKLAFWARRLLRVASSPTALRNVVRRRMLRRRAARGRSIGAQ